MKLNRREVWIAEESFDAGAGGDLLFDSNHLKHLAFNAPEGSTPRTCEWHRLDEEDDRHYETSCGTGWAFTDGGVKENHVKFCQTCGGEVIEVIV